VAALYNFVHLAYKTIDFDEQLKWQTPQQEIFSQSLKIEGSALLPLGGGMSFQIGYGFAFDWMQFDTESPSLNKKQYALLTVKRTGN
jgi:hypothetical protein